MVAPKSQENDKRAFETLGKEGSGKVENPLGEIQSRLIQESAAAINLEWLEEYIQQSRR